jgi:hypothetical protein
MLVTPLMIAIVLPSARVGHHQLLAGRGTRHLEALEIARATLKAYHGTSHQAIAETRQRLGGVDRVWGRGPDLPRIVLQSLYLLFQVHGIIKWKSDAMGAPCLVSIEF